MIQTEDLSKQFGDFWAVDGVTLQVQPGQVLALLGQNGAGKLIRSPHPDCVYLPHDSIYAYELLRSGS